MLQVEFEFKFTDYCRVECDVLNGFARFVCDWSF